MIRKLGYIDRGVMAILENHHKGGHKSSLIELLNMK